MVSVVRESTLVTAANAIEAMGTIEHRPMISKLHHYGGTKTLQNQSQTVWKGKYALLYFSFNYTFNAKNDPDPAVL